MNVMNFNFKVASLIRGEYEDSLCNFDIIDCRYPYEYEGGHIQVSILMFGRYLFCISRLLAIFGIKICC